MWANQRVGTGIASNINMNASHFRLTRCRSRFPYADGMAPDGHGSWLDSKGREVTRCGAVCVTRKSGKQRGHSKPLRSPTLRHVVLLVIAGSAEERRETSEQLTDSHVDVARTQHENQLYRTHLLYIADPADLPFDASASPPVYDPGNIQSKRRAPDASRCFPFDPKTPLPSHADQRVPDAKNSPPFIVPAAGQAPRDSVAASRPSLHLEDPTRLAPAAASLAPRRHPRCPPRRP